MQDVVEARNVGEHTIWLRFEDGTQGEIDLAEELDGPVFEPLKDETYFRHRGERLHRTKDLSRPRNPGTVTDAP